jgi:hypothetical protein
MKHNNKGFYIIREDNIVVLKPNKKLKSTW